MYALSVLMIVWPQIVFAASRWWYSLLGAEFDALIKSKARILMSIRMVGGIVLATSVYMTFLMSELQHTFDSFGNDTLGVVQTILNSTLLV